MPNSPKVVGKTNGDQLDRPSAFQTKTKAVMYDVKCRLGCPQAHTAHQLSYDTIEETVLKHAQAGNHAALEHFVNDFLKTPNSLQQHPEVEADPKLKHNLTNLIDSQKADILHQLDLAQDSLAHSKGNVDSQTSMQGLTTAMCNYVGNLMPGHGSTNRSIGSQNDLHFDNNGLLTPRSKWIQHNFPAETPWPAEGKVRSFVTDPKQRSEVRLKEQTATDGVELQLVVGNRSADPIRIGHVKSQSYDESETIRNGTRVKKAENHQFDGWRIGTASMGKLQEDSVTFTMTADAQVILTHTFNGHQLELGIPCDPLQDFQGRAAWGHTVDQLSTHQEEANGWSSHEEQIATNGVELQLVVGNRSADPIRIGHVKSQSYDESETTKDGIKVKKAENHHFDGYCFRIASMGRLQEDTVIVTTTADAQVIQTHTFDGQQHGVNLGVYKSDYQTGDFKDVTDTPLHKWTDSADVKHSAQSHEVFAGTEIQEEQSALFGLWTWGKHDTKTGEVHGTSRSTSEKDAVENGQHIISNHSEKELYDGERTVVDGQMTQENVDVSKDLYDHTEKVAVGDSSVEDNMTIDKRQHYEGNRVVDENGQEENGMWVTDEAVHCDRTTEHAHGILKTQHEWDVQIHTVAMAREGADDVQSQEVSGTSSSSIRGLTTESQSFHIENGEGDWHQSCLFLVADVHGKMHYDSKNHSVALDESASRIVTLSPSANFAIAACASTALAAVVHKGYLDGWDALQICTVGTGQFVLFTLVKAMADTLEFNVNLLTGGLANASQELWQIWCKSTLSVKSRVMQSAIVFLGAVGEVAFCYLFARNPHLTVFIACGRFGRAALVNVWDWWVGNITKRMALTNVARSPYLAAAVAAYGGAKLGGVIGACLGPLSLGLGVAIGGAVGSVVGGLLYSYGFEKLCGSALAAACAAYGGAKLGGVIGACLGPLSCGLGIAIGGAVGGVVGGLLYSYGFDKLCGPQL